MNRAVGAGSAMHAGAPPLARSKELSSGPSSSQPARRRGRAARCGTAEKSGARKGLASCREITDCGTTRVCGPPGVLAGLAVGAVSSRAARGSRRGLAPSRAWATGRPETPESSASRASSPASWTAVAARMAAMPSRRLSCSARWLPLPAAASTRARSSRSSSAALWNLARTAGVTRPRRAAASTSRTVRESTENTSPRWRTLCCFRGAVRRAPCWRWPGRAKSPPLHCRGAVAAAACRSVPGTGRETSRTEACSFGPPSRFADLQGSTQIFTARISRGPGAADGRAGDHDTGKSPPDNRFGPREA